MNINIDIVGKLFGLVLAIIGLALCYVEYVISKTMSELSNIVSDAMGLSGSSSFGLEILFHIPVGGLMFVILVVIVLLFYFAYLFIKD